MGRSEGDPPRPPGRVGRLGLALAAPRWALAIADDPAEPGRAGTDLIALLGLALVAAHARALVGAGWLAAAIDPGVGARALLGVIARGATVPLAFLVVAAAVIWLAAGRRRALGRDLDLACVAVVPLVAVELVATLAARAAGLDLPPAASWAVAAAGYGWAGALVALAVAQARRRGGAAAAGQAAAHLPAPRARAGRGAGLAAVAVAAALVVVQGGWIARHLDWLRPMAAGDRAPAFALPRIEAGGAAGAAVRSDDLRGRVVVLDFWATWCGPCRAAMPPLSALAARRPDVVVLSVNLDDPAKARALFDAEGWRTTLVADAGDAAERYGVGAIPHLVVIDADGVVRRVSRGEGDLRAVIELAERLAGER